MHRPAVTLTCDLAYATHKVLVPLTAKAEGVENPISFTGIQTQGMAKMPKHVHLAYQLKSRDLSEQRFRSQAIEHSQERQTMVGNRRGRAGWHPKATGVKQPQEMICMLGARVYVQHVLFVWVVRSCVGKNSPKVPFEELADTSCVSTFEPRPEE